MTAAKSLGCLLCLGRSHDSYQSITLRLQRMFEGARRILNASATLAHPSERTSREEAGPCNVELQAVPSAITSYRRFPAGVRPLYLSIMANGQIRQCLSVPIGSCADHSDLHGFRASVLPRRLTSGLVTVWLDSSHKFWHDFAFPVSSSTPSNHVFAPSVLPCADAIAPTMSLSDLILYFHIAAFGLAAFALFLLGIFALSWVFVGLDAVVHNSGWLAALGLLLAAAISFAILGVVANIVYEKRDSITSAARQAYDRSCAILSSPSTRTPYTPITTSTAHGRACQSASYDHRRSTDDLTLVDRLTTKISERVSMV